MKVRGGGRERGRRVSERKREEGRAGARATDCEGRREEGRVIQSKPEQGHQWVKERKGNLDIERASEQGREEPTEGKS